MGFHLNCVFTLDMRVFGLYDTMIPGGSAYVLPAVKKGWPDGWILPLPWYLEYGVDGRVVMDPAALEPNDLDAWRAAADIPAEPDPLGAFCDDDHLLGSVLSLAAPVMLIGDETFGGVLHHEYAAVFKRGMLVAASGIDQYRHTASQLKDGTFHAADPPMIDPTAQCAEILHDRFRDGFFYDGYLPRAANQEGIHPLRAPWSGPAPSVDPAWAQHFPILCPA